MRIAVVQFPGSNCERETILAIKRAEMEPIPFLWNENHLKLQNCDGFVLVGGFSYEDRGRAGIVAANDPLMQAIKAESQKGKPVLGICNGAQILVESGLVPGIENHKIGLALTDNKRIQANKILGTGYYNNWVYLRLAAEYQRNAFTRFLNRKSIISVPVAHAEGRFVMSDALLAEVKAQGLGVFQYCDSQGNIHSDFPINPNGSVDNLAAIANKEGNILAIMPHPERTIAGDPLFQSMHEYLKEGRFETLPSLSYYPRYEQPRTYVKKSGIRTCTVSLMITDNHALTIQKALQQQGLPVKVKRQLHWEVDCDDEATWQAIKSSGVLFNPNKEQEIPSITPRPALSLLVKAKDDVQGQEKQQMLKDHFNIQGVRAISQGTLWHFSPETDTIPGMLENILKTHIIYNPYAHDCYRY